MPLLPRRDAIAVLEDGHERLGALFGRLPDEEVGRPATIGGGEWSAKDLMGHIAFWEQIAVDTIEAFRQGAVLRFDQAYVPGGTNALNAWNWRRKAGWSPGRMRRESERTHRRLVLELGRLTDDQWRETIPSPVARRSRLGTQLGRVLSGPRLRFGHAFAHLPDLEAYVAGGRRP